jgi:CspA family cold shock protein
MKRGTVKWFNAPKGYGFIIPEEGGADVLVHYSIINMEGYRTLSEGQPVLFKAEESSRGLAATVVVV